MLIPNIVFAALLTTAPSLPDLPQIPEFDLATIDVQPIAVVTDGQVQAAGRFLLDKAQLIATLAHPTLVLDNYEGYVDGDSIVLEFSYEPSGILGRRYTTRIRYRLDSGGIRSTSIVHDDTVFGAFAGLELLKSAAADMLHQAREEKQKNNEEVSHAVRALEAVLSSDVSGNELHRLLLRLLWAKDGMVARYNNAG